MLIRLLQKVLALRIDKAVCIHDQQCAFRRGFDGCRDNTVLLHAILRSRMASHRSLYIATIDIAKAFDSVEHYALVAASEAAGLPSELLDYVKEYYARGSTMLFGAGWNSAPQRMTRGVRQGDPLSLRSSSTS